MMKPCGIHHLLNVTRTVQCDVVCKVLTLNRSPARKACDESPSGYHNPRKFRKCLWCILPLKDRIHRTYLIELRGRERQRLRPRAFEFKFAVLDGSPITSRAERNHCRRNVDTGDESIRDDLGHLSQQIAAAKAHFQHSVARGQREILQSNIIQRRVSAIPHEREN
jgi:hypothetical protein